MRIPPLLAAALITASLPSFPPTSSASGGGFLVLDLVSISNPSFIAWRLQATNESSITVQADAVLRNGGMQAWGFSVLRSDTLQTEAEFWGASVYDDLRIIADAGRIPIHASSRSDPFCTLALVGSCSVSESLTHGLTAGNWTVLAILGHDVQGDAINVTLLASSGVTLENRTLGPAFLDREEQFHGQLNILAQTPVLVAPKLMLNADLTHAFSRAFFGCFCGVSYNGQLKMSVQTPTGREDGRTVYLFRNAAPGAYAFHVDQDLELAWGPVIWFLGAGVVLP